MQKAPAPDFTGVTPTFCAREVNRNTGRTTRMLEVAINLAIKTGQSSVVIVRTEAHGQSLRDICETTFKDSYYPWMIVTWTQFNGDILLCPAAHVFRDHSTQE